MTKDQVVNFRENVAKGKIIKVVCDNQHIFYDNIAQYAPIIWDDANETFTVVRVNPDANAQDLFPYETVQTTYEMIQFMHCFDTAANAIKIMNELGTNLDDEQKKAFKKFLSETACNRKGLNVNYSQSQMYDK